ncbi:uncharacterized protein LOC106662376 isoform X2 [Cimex lectularius]|uniref:Odorant receptor n=1 Tax=Cimex lectularius TaxID=79782 RepID=A0A8I6SFQ9_CIMLE|nr:uncharacterized protein LOC106662376 isoform X2 [Cimex lectularius]
MSIIIGWNDYDVRFECLNVTLLLGCMFSFIILYWIKKDKVFYLYRALGSELHEYDVGGETLEHINRLRAESKIEKQKIPRINFIMCCSVMLLISFRRPLNYLIKGETRHARDGADLPSSHFVGGIPIPYWFYVEPKGNLYYLAAFLEYFNIIYVALLFPIIDGAFVAMSHEICTEFKILHYMLKNLVETAEVQYEKSSPNSSIKDMNKFKIILKSCLRSCLIHHQHIIKVISVIRDVNYMLLVLSGLGIGIFTCLLGVVLTVPGTSEALKASSFILILLELIHVYFYCYYSVCSCWKCNL